MKKNISSLLLRRSRLFTFLGWCFLVWLGSCCVWTAYSPAQAADVELVMEQMAYTTRDQVEISGSWIVAQDAPTSKKGRPVVMLLHDYGFDRRDWGIFIPDLVEHGYNVLAIDFRGHGQSAGSLGTSANALMQSGPLDVEPAFEWIRSQKQSDHDNISIVGVGMGADIAYLCAGSFSKSLRATVAISPSYNPITYGSIMGERPEEILFCVTRTGKNGKSRLAVDTLSNFSKDPKKVIEYDGSAHGLGIFYAHPEVREEIFDWLSQ